jgi:hypothetical protein
VRTGRIRKPAPGTVLGVVALVLALGGTAYALGVNTVKSKHIVNGQVKIPDLAANAVTAAKLAPNAVDGDAIADGAIGPADLAATPAVRAQSPSESFNNDQILDNGDVPEALQFDEELYDNGDFHTSGSYDAEGSKFFAPIGGLYEVSAGIIFSDPTTGYGTKRQLFLTQHDTNTAGDVYLSGVSVPPQNPGATVLNVSSVTRLHATDYVQAFVSHDAGADLVAALSQLGLVGDGRSYLSMTYLGP